MPASARLRLVPLALLPGLGGCASQMPPVSGFFAGNTLQTDVEGGGVIGGDGFEGSRDASRHTCVPDSVGGQAVLRCSESPGWHLYEDPPVRLGIGLSVGERWRIGLDNSSWSLQGGWRGDHLGALGWITPPGSFGLGWKRSGRTGTGLTGGLALAEYTMLRPGCSLGGFQFLGRIPHLETWGQASVPPLLWAHPEAGFGGWIRFGKQTQFAVEGRTGRDFDAGVWRSHLTLSVGLGASIL